jgi:hypothetical protein
MDTPKRAKRGLVLAGLGYGTIDGDRMEGTTTGRSIKLNKQK